MLILIGGLSDEYSLHAKGQHCDQHCTCKVSLYSGSTLHVLLILSLPLILPLPLPLPLTLALRESFGGILTECGFSLYWQVSNLVRVRYWAMLLREYAQVNVEGGKWKVKGKVAKSRGEDAN